MTEGPPRFYRGVCVRRDLGFLGGPSGYEEASEAEAARGPIVIDGRNIAEFGLFLGIGTTLPGQLTLYE